MHVKFPPFLTGQATLTQTDGGIYLGLRSSHDLAFIVFLTPMLMTALIFFTSKHNREGTGLTK